MSPANNSGSRPSGRGGSSSRSSSPRSSSGRPSSGRPSSGRPSSGGSRGGSSSSRPGSSRPSGSYRDGASSGGRTASGRDSSDRSSYSGRPSTSHGDSSRPSSRPSSDRGERSYGSRDSRPSSRPSSDRGERSYGSRDSRPSSDRSDRPSRSYGDRPERRDDRRPSSDRPAGRSYGDRDSRPSSRPSSDRGERSYGSRDSRPSSRPSSDRGERSYGSRDSRTSSDRPSRSYGDRPERRDDRRPSSDRPAGRSYGDRDSRPSSRPSSDRPRSSTEGRSTDRRDDRGYGSRDSRPSTDKPRRSNPFGGDRPKASDDRRPSTGRPAGRSYGSRDDRPSRDDRGGSRYSERGGRPDRAGGRFADDREERPRGRVGEKRVNVQDPIIPDHVTGEELPRAVRNELRTLPEGLALRVARHLAASVEAATVNPEISWQHAKAALSKASRVGIIREAAAEAAYNAGHYAEALIEFRAARRMRGIKEYWPLMADCERACGRPMKAIEMAGDPLVKNLDHASRVEMRIVAAGARMDMGNLDAALATLQCPDLTVTSVEPWSARIRYAYADVLEQMDRREEALEWFHRAAAVDADMLTDSDQRIRKLEGKSSDSDNDDEYGYEDLEDFDYSGEFGDQEDSGDNDEAIKE